MADEQRSTGRGKDTLPRKKYEKLPPDLCPVIPGESKAERLRRYSRARHAYLVENDPTFKKRTCDIAARARQRNPEHLKAKKLAYCERSREKEAARAAKWYAENRERGLESRRRYYQENVEKNRIQCREWSRNNPEKKAAIQHAQRVKAREAGGRFTADDVKEIFALQRGKCALCRTKLTEKNRHLDHIYPLALGGTNHRRNLQWLCATCNQSKGAKDPVDHSRRIGRLL